MLSTRIQDVLLAILAVIAVGLSIFAFRAVNAPATAGLGTPPASATAPSAAAVDDDSATTSQAPEDTGRTSGPDDEVSVSTWVDAWSGDESDLLVIGDGYSHLPEQWVQRWAGIVSDDRPVAVRHWGEAEDRAFNDPIVLSEGDGPTLTVWSASRDDTTIAQAASRLDRFISAGADPEAVLVSLGQASGAEDIEAHLDDLVDGLDDLPVLVVVGPAGLYDDGVGDAFSAWAEENADRVAPVDLRDSLPSEPTADEWAQAFAGVLSAG